MDDRPSTSNDCSITYMKEECPLKPLAFSPSEMKDDRPSSPHDCAICLEQLKDKSFTNSCLHMFCYPCLLAWSKVKPECPLCKQDFCSIIHNIRSMTDYDEYHVPPPIETHVEMYFPSIYPHLEPSRTSFLGSQRRFFSYRSTLMANNFSFVRDSSSNLVIQPYVDNLEFQNDFPRVHSTPNCLLKRMDIYLRNLETLPPPTNGRYRESSPEFYRENEGQLHRLARWLNRELEALSQIGVRFIRYEVQRLIVDLLPVYYINSDILHNIVHPHLGEYTRHFLKEFYKFAISPFETDQYDRECTFAPRRNRSSHLSFIVTVGRDDTEDVQVIPERSAHTSAVRQWIDVNNFASSPHFRTTTQTPTHRNETSIRTNSNTSTEPAVIYLDDSDNDCIIIDEPNAPTIIVDDSDETDTITRVPFENISGPSGPLDLSTSRIEELSSSNHITTSCHEMANPRIRSLGSCSNRAPSVLSTEISSDENRSTKCKRKKSKKHSKLRSSSLQPKRKRRSVGEYALYEYLSNSSSEEVCEDDNDDEDWQYEKAKRKRKTKKRVVKKEKKTKSKKHEKKKRKSMSLNMSAAEVSDEEKHTKKSKRKDDKCGCSSAGPENKMEETTVRTNEVVDAHATNVPKLKSVVKKVKPVIKNRELTNLFDYLKDTPSTSRGYNGYYQEIRSPSFSRSSYFSDSD